MEQKFQIDVIVPVYNGAAYIESFFAMFARQADDAVRLLFVDDGSTDGAGALLDRCAAAAAFPVRVIHRDNAGVSAARNAGMAASDAEYIAFFDIDDLAAPYYTAALKGAAARGADVFVFAQRRVTDEDVTPVVDEGGEELAELPAEEQLRRLLADPTRLGVYNLLLRRAYINAAGLRFAEGYPYYEDYDFLYRAFAGAKTILRTERALYFYVLRDGSAMSRFDAGRLRCLALMERLEPWLEEKAPGFAPEYRRWGVARLYWSVLWQAALAAPDYAAFCRFAAKTHAEIYLSKLRGFPSRRVAASARLYALSKRAYYAAVRRLGGRRSGVRRLAAAEFDAASEGCPDPRKILVYGMTDNPGGIESYLMGFLRRQPAGTVDFLCDFPAIAYADEIRARGAQVHFIPAKSQSLSGHWRETARVLRAHPEYTAVYLNVLDAGCVFLAAVPWLYRRRIVVHSHNGDTDKTRLHRLCRPLLGRMTDGRASCSDAASRHMFGRTGGDILFVPNAIDAKQYRYDPELRAEKRAELGLRDRLALCHVGRISRQKNPLFLLDILAAVRERRPDAALLSVGEGEMAAAFDARIRALGLEDAVLRLGRRPDVPALLQAADVFLLPSLYEGLSIALLEAQAAGLPSVASDAISPQTVVTDTVRFAGLSEPARAWADAALAAAEMPRRDTFDAIARAGFDVSGCAASDEKLLRLLRGE